MKDRISFGLYRIATQNVLQILLLWNIEDLGEFELEFLGDSSLW